MNNAATSLKDTIAEFAASMAKHAPPEVIATLGAEIKSDRNGVVLLSHVDPNYMLRLEPAAILDTLRTARA